MTHKELAKTIVEKIGGSENVTLYTHCITRLRFILKDKSKVDEDGLRELKEVMGIVDRGGQYQIVIGSDVERVFNELAPFLPNVEQDNPEGEKEEAKESTEEKKSPLQTVMSYVSASIAPTITVIVAAGLINAVLAIAVQFGLDNQGSTYTVWNSFAQLAFSYLPVWLAFSAAKYLKTDGYVAAFITAATITLFSSAKNMSVFGISIPEVNYSGAIVPVLLMVPVLAVLDKFLTNHLHKNLVYMFKPLNSRALRASAGIVCFWSDWSICRNSACRRMYRIDEGWPDFHGNFGSTASDHCYFWNAFSVYANPGQRADNQWNDPCIMPCAGC